MTSPTEQQIREMSAGREMYTLVAELMGWTVYHEDDDPDEFFGIPPDSPIQVEEQIYPYSTAIAFAMDVPEKLDLLAFRIYRESPGCGDIIYDITLYDDGNFADLVQESFFEPLPAAICRAALLWDLKRGK